MSETTVTRKFGKSNENLRPAPVFEQRAELRAIGSGFARSSWLEAFWEEDTRRVHHVNY